MFAINHVATAVTIKRWFPGVPLVPLLLSVQAVEFVWVALNYAGIERTTTDAAVRYVGDIHLAYMPYSHSIATTLALALTAWLVGRATGHRALGISVAAGVLSHIVLDLATHNADIALAPVAGSPRLGSHLYGRWPAAAFALELAYGMLCWAIYRGTWRLFVVILVFNLANVSLFFREIPGPEHWVAGRPLLITTVILVQIAVTLVAVYGGARRRRLIWP